jgi:hypothetical protein
MPMNKNQVTVLINYLNNNPKINIEFNTDICEGSEPDDNTKAFEYLTIVDAATFLIANGIDSARITCKHLAESKIPMFRFVKA